MSEQERRFKNLVDKATSYLRQTDSQSCTCPMCLLLEECLTMVYPEFNRRSSPPSSVGDAIEFAEWLRTFEVLTKEHGYWVLESQVSTEYLYKHFRSSKGALPVEPPPSSVVGEAEKKRPKIVCFCGSSRFCGEMAILMWEWEKAGHIAIGLHYMPPQYGEAKGYVGEYHHLAEMEGIAEQMDELHKRKIDLADEIFVVNVRGYTGSSTRSEIEYATAHNKPVKYLENPSSPNTEKGE